MIKKLKAKYVCKKEGHTWVTLVEPFYKIRQCKRCEKVEYNVPIYSTGWVTPEEFDEMFE